jgi:hypothetical protein
LNAWQLVQQKLTEVLGSRLFQLALWAFLGAWIVLLGLAVGPLEHNQLSGKEVGAVASFGLLSGVVARLAMWGSGGSPEEQRNAFESWGFFGTAPLLSILIALHLSSVPAAIALGSIGGLGGFAALAVNAWDATFGAIRVREKQGTASK